MNFHYAGVFIAVQTQATLRSRCHSKSNPMHHFLGRPTINWPGWNNHTAYWDSSVSPPCPRSQTYTRSSTFIILHFNYHYQIHSLYMCLQLHRLCVKCCKPVIEVWMETSRLIPLDQAARNSPSIIPLVSPCHNVSIIKMLLSLLSNFKPQMGNSQQRHSGQ